MLGVDRTSGPTKYCTRDGRNIKLNSYARKKARCRVGDRCSARCAPKRAIFIPLVELGAKLPTFSYITHTLDRRRRRRRGQTKNDKKIKNRGPRAGPIHLYTFPNFLCPQLTNTRFSYIYQGGTPWDPQKFFIMKTPFWFSFLR